MEWQTSLRPKKKRLCSLAWIWFMFIIKICLVKQEWNPNFLPSVLLAQVWSQWVIGHFGNLVTSPTTYMFDIFENSSRNYVKLGQEVRSKSWLKMLKISLSVLVSWTCLHKLITWNQSIFRTCHVLQSFISHWYLQLSCWKFPLNHLASWWKFDTKLWKNMNFLPLMAIWFG